mgnify:CR=1 FL=1
MAMSTTEEWFRELQRIWLEKDIPALRAIIADDFTYYEDPFAPAITTWQELQEVWQEIKEQDIKHLAIIATITGERQGAARYEFIFHDSHGVQHESRGAYYVALNEAGRATEFRQWWTEKGA